MHRLARYVEQLQLAGVYIHEKKSHQLARLSLILCDNVVELLAHERCLYHQRMDASFWRMEPKLSKNDQAKALGQKFNPKLNLLVQLGDVKPAERDFATRAHLLRNECYHNATLNEQIAGAVAWEYHELACTLFERLRQPGYILGGTIFQSEASRMLLEEAGFNGGFPDIEKAHPILTGLLRKTKPPIPEPLGIVLAAAAKRRFSQLIHAIESIAHDGVQSDVPDEAIKEVYFRVAVDIQELTVDLNTQTHEGFVEGHRRVQEAHAKYVPSLRFKRVVGWLKRADALLKEQNATSAMIKYMDLLRESREAHTIIHEAATQLDLAIDNEINVRLGK